MTPIGDSWSGTGGQAQSNPIQPNSPPLRRLASSMPESPFEANSRLRTCNSHLQTTQPAWWKELLLCRRLHSFSTVFIDIEGCHNYIGFLRNATHSRIPGLQAKLDLIYILIIFHVCTACEDCSDGVDQIAYLANPEQARIALHLRKQLLLSILFALD